MTDLMLDVYAEIQKGELSFSEIAEKFDIPVTWIPEVIEMMTDDTFDLES